MRDLLGFWLAVAALIGYCLWAIPGECENCGNECVNQYSCLSGCVCAFPEGDDNEHYGRCVRSSGY